MPKINIENLLRMAEEAEEADAKKAEEVLQDELIYLPVDELQDFPAEKNRFRPAGEKRMAELMEDIRLNGVLNPLLVRRLPDGRYQILAGHNRRRAARELGMKTVPCIIKKVPSDDDAVLILNCENLSHRPEILPSERAFAYKDKLDILKRQGQRFDLTSRPAGEKLTSVAKISSESTDSERQIQRYIRLTYLIPDLLGLVDAKKIGLRVGVQLSFLSHHSQEVVRDCCYWANPPCSLTEAQAKELRAIEEDPEQVIDGAVIEATNSLYTGTDRNKAAQYYNLLRMEFTAVSQDRSTPYLIICDEAQTLFDPELPQAAHALYNIALRVRKYEGCLWLAFHSLHELLDDSVRLYGQPILDAAAYKILFGTDGRNLADTVNLFKLTPAEEKSLEAKQRRRALALLGSSHIQVDFELPRYKLELMGTGGGR